MGRVSKSRKSSLSGRRGGKKGVNTTNTKKARARRNITRRKNQAIWKNTTGGRLSLKKKE